MANVNIILSFIYFIFSISLKNDHDQLILFFFKVEIIFVFKLLINNYLVFWI